MSGASEGNAARGGTGILVRPSGPGDIEPWRQAVGFVARESGFLAFRGTPPKRSAAAFARLIANRGYPQFVAVTDDGRLVGWCDVVASSDRGVFAHRGTLGIGVLARWRGLGIGRRLIEATVAAAFARGFARLELRVRADNAVAIALYESVGFRREGVLRGAFRVDGVDYDEVVMGLLAAER